MNAIIEKINSIGYAFIDFALPMLIQAGVLIVLLLLADFILRKRVRAVFRYWIWMLVLVKLVLPTSLAGPFSLGYWFGDEIASVDISQPVYEPQPIPQFTASATPLPYIDVSNIRPPIYQPPTSPSMTQTELASAEPPVSPIQIQWQGVVFLLWLAIVIALLLLLAQRAIFVRTLVAQAKNASGAMCDALNDCRKRMKVKRKVGLKVSPNATSPAVCGLFRPIILVPNNLSTALGAEDLHVVLLHELSHIKRGDLWINLAQTLLQIIYFYNPLLWLANAVIRRAREQAVDEAVLVAMGEKASRYPETLVSVAKLAFKRPALSLRLIGVVESKSALTARIKRILTRPIPKSAKLGILGLTAIIITAAFILPMAQAQPYTDRAAKIMSLAEKQARKLNHAYIGTEHILLALAEQSEGVAAKVLDNLGVDTDALLAELRKLVKTGSDPVTKRRLPQTARAKKVFKHAREEAKLFGHDYIGTEHILLGLMREKNGVAFQILAKLGVRYDVTREVFDLVDPKWDDRDMLVAFEQHSDGPPEVRQLAGAEVFSKKYDVRFEHDKELLVVAELYQVGKPMRLLGHKVFTGDSATLPMNLQLSRKYNDSDKTNATFSLDVTLGDQALSVDPFQVLTTAFLNSTALRAYEQEGIRKLGDKRRKIDYGRLHLLFSLSSHTDSTDDSPRKIPRIWTPGDNISQFGDYPYYIFVKMIPLSRLEFLLIEPPKVGSQGLDGAVISPSSNDKQLKALAENYIKMIKTEVASNSITEEAPSSVDDIASLLRIVGQVSDDAGRPIAGAQVALSSKDLGVKISQGKLGEIYKDIESRIVETDSAGIFDLGEYPNGDFHLIVACEEGFAFSQPKGLGRPYDMQIEPWGRIEGQLAPDRKATENQIWMASLPNWTFLPHRQQLTGDTICDAEGRFVFDKVPAGWFEVGYLVPTGQSGYSHTCRTPIEVKAGQTANMTLGGIGRPVVGKFAPPAGYEESMYFGAGLRSLVTVRPKQPRPENYDRMSEQQQRRWRDGWRRSDEYEKYLDAGWRNKNWRQYTFEISKDGSFRIEDVIEGKYKMTVSIERYTGQGPQEEIAGYYGTVEVPAIPGGRSDEPLDLGKLELSPSEQAPPNKATSTHRTFSATLANGVTVELVGLFSGVEEDKRAWWRPDGSELPKDSFQPYNEHVEPKVWDDQPEEQLRYGYVYTVAPSKNVELISDVSEGTQWHTGFADAERTTRIGYVYSQTVEQRENFSAVGGIKIAAATGDAKRLESKVYSGNVEDTHILAGGTSMIVSGPREYREFDEKMVDVTVAGSDIHVAVSYELKSGAVKTAKRDSVMGGPSIVSFYGTHNPMHQHSFRVFDPWDQITKFIVHYRKFELATFKNVALRPGHETDVQIEVEKPASNNSTEDPKSRTNITLTEGTSIREALRVLGKAYKKNIILSDKVAGQVPVTDLYDVTFEETLQAVLGTHKYIIDGDLIRVYTKEEFESIYPDHKTGVTVREPVTIRVPEDHPTLVAAVNAAKDGDTLIVDADHYVGEEASTMPKYSATLPDGATVELLGICKYDGASKQWWRPNGSVFDPPMKVEEYEEYRGQDRLGFAVKHNTTDFRLAYEIGGVSGHWGMNVYDADGTKLPYHRAAVVRLSEGRDSAAVRIGIAAGEWEVVAEYDGGQMTFAGPNDIVFSQPIETVRGTTIALRGEWGFDGTRRIVAIDKAGKIHDGGWRGRSTGLKTLATVEFRDLKPDQIAKYQMQFRPYQWATFKNVSLRPGHITDAQVKPDSTQPGYPATQANRVAVELLGVCDIPADGKQWWAADGSPVDNVYWDGTGLIHEDAEKARQVVLRIDSQETDPDLQPMIALSVHRNSTPAGSWSAAFFVHKGNRTLQDLRGCSFSLHDDHPTVDISATVGFGQWKTQTTRSVKSSGNLNSTYTGIGTLIVNDPTEKDGKATISATLLGQVKAWRFVAIDNKGKIHTGSSSSYIGLDRDAGANTPEHQICKTEFALPLSQIEKFQFQTRKVSTTTFKNVSLASGKKTDVQIEVEPTPKDYSAVDAPAQSSKTPSKYSTTLANGARVELAAYSKLTEKGLEWYAPDGKSTAVNGVTEADVDGLGTVLALRVTPADIDLIVRSYRGTETKTHTGKCRVGSSDIWLVPLREERRFVNLEIWVTVHGPPMSHTIDLAGPDFDREIEVDKFGVAKMLVSGPQDSDLSEVKVVWDSLENRNKWKLTGLSALEKSGESHELTADRGTSRYRYFKVKTNIPWNQLAAIVLEAKKRHPSEAKFKNISLVPGKKTDVQIEVEPMPEGYGPVDADASWGKPVEGLGVRLRAEGTTAAERVTLLVDAQNDGPATHTVLKSTNGCWLEVNEKWYQRIPSRETVSSVPLKPGDRQLALAQLHLAAGQNRLWRRGVTTENGRIPPAGVENLRPPHKLLELATGHYTVRIALAPNKPGEKTYAYSNALEIEILPAGSTNIVGREPAKEDGPAPAVTSVEIPDSKRVTMNWPSFRGPGGGGISASANAPTEWDGPSGRIYIRGLRNLYCIGSIELVSALP